MTTEVKNGTITVPAELLKKADLHEGDSVYVDVDDNGVLHVERTRVYESGEEFLAAIRARIET